MYPIDRVEFGTVADCLRSPSSPVDHLLHLKSREMLSSLAEELLGPRKTERPPWNFPVGVERGLREGTILVSSRHPFELNDPKRRVEASAIPRQAIAQAIFAPPFYLVHTRGLFEGTLLRPQVELNPAVAQRLKRGSGQKL